MSGPVDGDVLRHASGTLLRICGVHVPFCRNEAVKNEYSASEFPASDAAETCSRYLKHNQKQLDQLSVRSRVPVLPGLRVKAVDEGHRVVHLDAIRDDGPHRLLLLFVLEAVVRYWAASGLIKRRLLISSTEMQLRKVLVTLNAPKFTWTDVELANSSSDSLSGAIGTGNAHKNCPQNVRQCPILR